LACLPLHWLALSFKSGFGGIGEGFLAACTSWLVLVQSCHLVRRSCRAASELCR
jgi:hypothetical protein